MNIFGIWMCLVGLHSFYCGLSYWRQLGCRLAIIRTQFQSQYLRRATTWRPIFISNCDGDLSSIQRGTCSDLYNRIDDSSVAQWLDFLVMVRFRCRGVNIQGRKKVGSALNKTPFDYEGCQPN